MLYRQYIHIYYRVCVCMFRSSGMGLIAGMPLWVAFCLSTIYLSGWKKFFFKFENFSVFYAPLLWCVAHIFKCSVLCVVSMWGGKLGLLKEMRWESNEGSINRYPPSGYNQNHPFAHRNIIQPNIIYSYVFKFKAVTSKSVWWYLLLCVSPPN